MIRKFQPSDMDRILDIWLNASVMAHDFVDKSFWISKLPEMRDQYIPSSETYVYDDDDDDDDDNDGGVSGFISLYNDTLAAVFVSPIQQGKGIGTQLINRAKKLRGQLILTVYKENPAAISFYKKHGFKEVNERIDEHTGRPEIVFSWKL